MNRRLLLSLIVSALAGSSLHAEPVSLKLQWQPGKKYVHQHDTQVKQQMTVPGAPAPMDQEMSMQQVVAVAVRPGAEAEARQLEMEFVSIKQDMNMNGQKISFDSSAPEKDSSNPMAAAMSGLVGAKITATAALDGQITDVKGLSELSEKMGPAGKAAPMLNDEMFKQMMSGMSNLLPPKPVSVGDKWPSEISMPMPGVGTMQMNIESTFQGTEERDGRDCAVIVSTGTMTMKADEKPNAMNMKLLATEGKITGKTWFDPAIGMMVANEMTQDADISIEVTPPGAGEAMKMSSKLVTTANSKLLKVEDLK